MIYLAATSAGDPASVMIGDPAELAEVRWSPLPEALTLMPDMFGPVRAYLRRALRPQVTAT